MLGSITIYEPSIASLSDGFGECLNEYKFFIFGFVFFSIHCMCMVLLLLFLLMFVRTLCGIMSHLPAIEALNLWHIPLTMWLRKLPWTAFFSFLSLLPSCCKCLVFLIIYLCFLDINLDSSWEQFAHNLSNLGNIPSCTNSLDKWVPRGRETI